LGVTGGGSKKPNVPPDHVELIIKEVFISLHPHYIETLISIHPPSQIKRRDSSLPHNRTALAAGIELFQNETVTLFTWPLPICLETI
jgi:hypothetical protein